MASQAQNRSQQDGPPAPAAAGPLPQGETVSGSGLLQAAWHLASQPDVVRVGWAAPLPLLLAAGARRPV